MIENIAIKRIGFLNKKQREYTEYKLVQQAQNGCDESFEKLINSYKEYLYKTAFLYVKNEHDALDIYQETVYKAYINIQKLRNTKFFKTWIIKILINDIAAIFFISPSPIKYQRHSLVFKYNNGMIIIIE